MRRIGIKHARLGMELGRAVLDSNSYIVLDAKIKLDKEALVALVERGVSEIFIQDPRTNDILIKPMIAPELESLTTSALKAFRERLKKDGVFASALFEELQDRLNAMVRQLFPKPVGEANVSGCLLPGGYSYVQPTRTACMVMLLGRGLQQGVEETYNLGMASLMMNLAGVPEPSESSNESSDPSNGGGAEVPPHYNHPVLTAKLLTWADQFSPEIVESVLHHHERWDGEGYPSGIAGPEIFAPARVIAIADAYYELVSSRPNRPGMMPHEAAEYILAYSGIMFDPAIVKLFNKLVPLYPTGTTVKLSSGEIGVVTNPNVGRIGRPTVRVCSLGKTGDVIKPFEIDLSTPKYQGMMVTEVDPYLSPV